MITAVYDGQEEEDNSNNSGLMEAYTAGEALWLFTGHCILYSPSDNITEYEFTIA